MTITFFGHFGSLNSGNESTLVAVISQLRARSPHDQFRCVCTNPDVVISRDRIEAVPISTREARIWNREVRLDRRLRMAITGVSEEMGQYVRAFKTLKGTRTMVIPGTGLLTDAYGLSGWGPYNLFKWSLAAKLRGARLLYLSVGVGPIYSALGRRLVKSALAMADYRSYRDDSSKSYLESIGFSKDEDRIYPDLVFSLPDDLLPDEGPSTRRPVVGLGLMLYAWKYSVENPTNETFAGYLDALVEFARWLFANDYDIRLLLGDGDDALVIDEFKDLLQARIKSFDEGRIFATPITTYQDVLDQFAMTDIVVATRFHNVLFALLLDKPVIAISFHHKCSSLMEQMGLSDYCHDINQIEADRLIDQFEDLVTNREAVKRQMRTRVHESQKALGEQYDLLFEAHE